MTAMGNNISFEILILYMSAYFGHCYDTVCGAQDMSDDEIIGLKSTSIKFKNNQIICFNLLSRVCIFDSLFIK